jgi:hypothetical protein
MVAPRWPEPEAPWCHAPVAMERPLGPSCALANSQWQSARACGEMSPRGPSGSTDVDWRGLGDSGGHWHRQPEHATAPRAGGQRVVRVALGPASSTEHAPLPAGACASARACARGGGSSWRVPPAERAALQAGPVTSSCRLVAAGCFANAAACPGPSACHRWVLALRGVHSGPRGHWHARLARQLLEREPSRPGRGRGRGRKCPPPCLRPLRAPL